MRGKRRAPRPQIPWRSPWTPLVCLVGTFAVGGLVAVSLLAKEVVVVVDGQPRTVRGFAASVRELLDDAGVELGRGDVVRPAVTAGLDDGDTVEVRRARPLTLTLDGRTTEHVVTATNVSDALAELDLDAAAGRLSAPPERAVPLSGMSLTMVTERKVYVIAGRTRVSARTTARTVREVLRQKRVRLGQGHRVRPGLDSFPQEGTVITVLPPRTVAVPADVLRLNWSELAQCESHGDPGAFTPEGPHYGMYQLSLPMWQAVGGSGVPSEWPEDEQTYRAQLLYQRVGGRWEDQWPNCGSRLFTRPVAVLAG
ncbi:DUF348 domain-containing protein [Nonomuraea sp. NN258]|uniref:resuscitation-promoting factor n=1 Tax=Nonomuraea antri TaxID=2730852 RepID=UPI0015683C58|nr:resuscitation-promoting factor [Nonomuraea antri]NRQ35016.1 DUF348 domain-containing protein [Nonomuraea antri]